MRRPGARTPTRWPTTRTSAARGAFVRHGGLVQPAPAPRFSRTPAALSRRPPQPGEHTAEALADWGFDADEIAALARARRDRRAGAGMKYGVTTFAAGFGPERFERTAALARRAEDAGFDAVWVSELYNRSATIPMATIAQATTRVAIGTNIAYGVGRTPLMWAAEARDLDELSGGRIILGLGNGTATMMEKLARRRRRRARRAHGGARHRPAQAVAAGPGPGPARGPLLQGRSASRRRTRRRRSASTCRSSPRA